MKGLSAHLQNRQHLHRAVQIGAWITALETQTLPVSAGGGQCQLRVTNAADKEGIQSGQHLPVSRTLGVIVHLRDQEGQVEVFRAALVAQWLGCGAEPTSLGLLVRDDERQPLRVVHDLEMNHRLVESPHFGHVIHNHQTHPFAKAVKSCLVVA